MHSESAKGFKLSSPTSTHQQKAYIWLVHNMCYDMCDDGQKTKCNHIKAERAITGTWPTPELDYAVSNCGYKIESIQEIWHWSERGELFTGYVNACIKEKQEASGFPAECIT